MIAIRSIPIHAKNPKESTTSTQMITRTAITPADGPGRGGVMGA